MKQVLRFNKVIKRIVFTGDLILLNGTFLSLYTLLGSKFFADPFIHSLPQVLVLLNLCYLVSNMSSGIILHRCVVRPEQIVWRALRNSAGHALFFSCALTFGNFGILSARFFLLFYIAFTLLLVCYRLLFRKILKSYRKHGGNSRSIILVGSNSNIIELYHQMTDDVTSGFRVIGYFDDQPGSRFPEKVNYLGKPGKIVDRLKQGGVEQVYCCLPSARSEAILPISAYYFHTINLNGFLANLVAVPLATFLLYAAMLCLIFPFLLSQYLAWIPEVTEKIIMGFLHIFAPYSFNLHHLYPSVPTVLLSYISLIFLYLYFTKPGKKWRRYSMFTLFILLCWNISSHFYLANRQEIIVFQLPQKSAIILNYKGYYTYLLRSSDSLPQTQHYIAQNNPPNSRNIF